MPGVAMGGTGVDTHGATACMPGAGIGLLGTIVILWLMVLKPS